MSLLNNLIHYELTWILNVDWKVGDPEPLEIPVTLLSLYPGCDVGVETVLGTGPSQGPGIIHYAARGNSSLPYKC